MRPFLIPQGEMLGELRAREQDRLEWELSSSQNKDRVWPRLFAVAANRPADGVPATPGPVLREGRRWAPLTTVTLAPSRAWPILGAR